jgi:hypothetical protein
LLLSWLPDGSDEIMHRTEVVSLIDIYFCPGSYITCTWINKMINLLTLPCLQETNSLDDGASQSNTLKKNSAQAKVSLGSWSHHCRSGLDVPVGDVILCLAYPIRSRCQVTQVYLLRASGDKDHASSQAIN